MEEMDLGNSEEKLRNIKMKEDEEDENLEVSLEPVNEDSLELEKEENDDGDTSQDEADESDEDADENEVKQLENILTSNPYDYASHVAIIAKLQAMGELDRLRLARENMSSKYPLSPELWLSWLRDEMKLVTNSEGREAVEKLCERAVRDYLSVEVWLEYLQFSIGIMGSSDKEKDGKNFIRELFERALTAVGLHVTKGAIIWEAFREFENVLVSMASTEVERKEEIDRIAALFRRQLACPLLDMERTLQEYQEWRLGDGKESSIDDNMVNSGYKRASEELITRLPFEEKLISCDSESQLLDAYKAYILHEKQNGDPGRVSILYERALADLSLEFQLWIDYLDYLESTIKLEQVLSPIYERATRNVPWCSKIWQKYMRSLEKWEKPLLIVQSVLENALIAGFPSAEDYRNIWMNYLEYLRRKIDPKSPEENKQIEVLQNAFNRACEHLAKLFGLDGDPQCIILQFWARTEAIHVSDMEKARSLWSDILSQGHSTFAASWLEYINLERCFGDTKHLRKLYQKAFSAVKDWPESIANSWLEFERDEGTLEQMEICEEKTRDRLAKVASERAKKQMEMNFIQPESGKKPIKRKPDDEGRWQALGISASKKEKIEKSKPKVKKENILILDGKIEEKKEKKIAPPPGFIPQVEEQEEEKMETSQDVDEKITVFISNLDYTATEDEVREALSPAGPVTLFKMVKDYKGRSKGFCYVQLSSTNAVEEALKLDRVPINGRPMFVSKCDPDKTTRGPGFKYAVSLEKNKIFVKGLPVTTTKEEVENIFKVHGELKDVRLVTYRNGHSKGLAYVEFKSVNSAGKAVLATDGMLVGDKVISVAISQPPERRKNIDDPQIKSLGGTSVSRSHFGVPKTLLSMIPRNVKPPSKNGSTPTQNEAKPMNNQDFRKMLLNKK